jgi:citronellol/citronellal dehydrogenase
MRLENRVALITGASRGIGREIALAFAREGTKVILAAKSVVPNPKLPGTLWEVAAEIEALGGEALVCGCDVRNENQITETVQSGLARFGRIDILINNAGALWWRPVLETPAKRFDLVMQVNARAAFLMSQAVLPSMINQGWGHIVNMSPPIDLGHMPGFVAYFISKYGMTLLTIGLAEEVREHNIAVNSLWPVTAIDTAAVRTYGVGTEEQWRRPEIMADATLELVSRPPSECTGKALSDEEILRAAGVSDFTKYAVVPGTEPAPLGWAAGKIRS